MLRGIIFDLDGTLGNTLPVSFKAYQGALLKFSGRTFSNDEITSLFGPDEEGIIKNVVPEQWQACLNTYLDIYDKVHVEYAQPFQGIEEALELFKQQNVSLAIVTGKGEHTTGITLRYLGLAHYFDAIEVGSSQGAIKPRSIKKIVEKWNFLPHEVAYVGDAAYDIHAAKEAGVVPLAAAWAETANSMILRKANPAAMFETTKDFIIWIKKSMNRT